MHLATRVCRWGASLAVRIPKRVAEQLGVDEGSAIELVPGENRLVLRPARFDLATLVAEIRPENRHGEVDWGRSRGTEAW